MPNTPKPLSPEAISSCFTALAQRLADTEWFRAGGWQSSVHGFPPEKPEAITFQVFQTHWFNADHHGIHFESYLAFNPAKQHKSYITLHLLHLPTLPGTAIPRKRLAEAVVDALYAEVSGWPGYTFRAGRYGQQPFVKNLNGTSPAFAAELEQELGRLCQQLGPVINAALESLTKSYPPGPNIKDLSQLSQS